MSHEVESMAYTNEVPWHGLGTYVADAPSVEEMIRIAGLDWTVDKKKLITAHNLVPLKKWFALTRSSDGKVLDVVGSRYTPVQNAEAFEFFKEFVEAGDATMETAGSLRGGHFVWGLANLNQSFNLNGNDEVKGYILVGAPHEQGKSLIIRLTNVRVVCNNTLSLALREVGPEFRMAHRQAFDSSMIETAKQTLGLAREQLREFEQNARILKATPMTTKEVIEICAQIMCPELDEEQVAGAVEDLDKNGTPRLKKILDCYEKAPGAEPGNAWGALNGITYYTDHIASKNPDNRLSSAWFGDAAKKKERALGALLELSA